MNSKEKYKRRAMEIIDFEPIKGCKHPFIASGATPIESTGRAPDEDGNYRLCIEDGNYRLYICWSKLSASLPK
jgi:topoisomerase IA-like protein